MRKWLDCGNGRSALPLLNSDANSIYLPWLNAALLEQTQLPPKEKVLSFYRSRRTQLKNSEPGHVDDELDNDFDQRHHPSIMT